MKVRIKYTSVHEMELDLGVFDEGTAIAEARNEYRRLAKNSSNMSPIPLSISIVEPELAVA
jgi:hypothetical protein